MRVNRRPIFGALPVATCSLALLTACGSVSPRVAPDRSAPSPSAAGETSSTAHLRRRPAAPAADPTGLRGGPGVSPAQLRRASALLASTIAALPRYASPARAYGLGYRSIGDTASRDEHYVNWAYVNDGHILDPARPESIVYEHRDGKEVAVAAMYSLPIGSSFADVPDVGGALTQWHVHRNLCLTNDPQQKIILRFTARDGSCPAGTSKASNTPMLHVWAVPNRCGPFASLEFGGQFAEGQTRNCDTRNASVP